jgi:hypothetical protein
MTFIYSKTTEYQMIIIPGHNRASMDVPLSMHTINMMLIRKKNLLEFFHMPGPFLWELRTRIGCIPGLEQFHYIVHFDYAPTR